MRENIGWIMSLAFGLPGLILISVGLWINRRNNIKKNQPMLKTTGNVIGYSSVGRDGVYYPKVEFYVKGESYLSQLRYKWIMTTSLPTKRETEIVGDPFAQTLRVKRSSFFSINPLAKEFPTGTEMTVYYQEDDPTFNYVERFTINVLGPICLMAGISTIIIGVICWFLMKKFA